MSNAGRARSGRTGLVAVHVSLLTRTPIAPARLQAVVSSWPDDCVFIFCPPDDDTPDLLEHRRLSDGACTHLDDDDVCPLNAEGVDDEKWFPEYGGCRKKRCPYGRYSTGTCRPRPTISPPAPPPSLAADPTPPTDVTADGHSPTDSSGQSVVTWEASDAEIQDSYTLARYELRYGKVPGPSLPMRAMALRKLVDLLPGIWLPRDPVTLREKPVTLSASSLTHTLTSLTLYTLYRVEVRAVYTAPPIIYPGGQTASRPEKLSEWRHAYTYPTHDPIPSTDGDIVGVIPIAGFRPADPGVTYSEIGQYRFVQCTNWDLLPSWPLAVHVAERDKLFRQVRLGFGTWAAAYDNIDVRYNPPDYCTIREVNRIGDEVAADEAAGEVHLNVVIFAASGIEIDAHCRQDDVAACAYRWPPTAGTTEIRSTKIVLNKNLDYENDLPNAPCTTAYAVAMHELGHAFGLNDTRALSILDSYGLWPTVMSNSMYSNCEPTALDIAAMKAIYQSR